MTQDQAVLLKENIEEIARDPQAYLDKLEDWDLGPDQEFLFAVAVRVLEDVESEKEREYIAWCALHHLPSADRFSRLLFFEVAVGADDTNDALLDMSYQLKEAEKEVKALSHLLLGSPAPYSSAPPPPVSATADSLLGRFAALELQYQQLLQFLQTLSWPADRLIRPVTHLENPVPSDIRTY